MSCDSCTDHERTKHEDTTMGFTETMLIYLLVGGGVAAAVLLEQAPRSAGERAFRVATALFFWPLFVPSLVAGHDAPRHRAPLSPEPSAQTDAMAVAIRQVECELDQALVSLDDWADNVLAQERDRLAELRSAWSVQAERIREMDALLLEAKAAADWAPRAETEQSTETQRRSRQSEMARQHNLELLHKVRDRAYDDLLATLAWVRELVSMIHLAKFTGAPASRAEQLVTQIAAAVEGISLVTWQDLEAVDSDVVRNEPRGAEASRLNVA